MWMMLHSLFHTVKDNSGEKILNAFVLLNFFCLFVYKKQLFDILWVPKTEFKENQNWGENDQNNRF